MWCNFPIRCETPQVSGQSYQSPQLSPGAMDSSSPRPGPLPPALQCHIQGWRVSGSESGMAAQPERGSQVWWLPEQCSSHSPLSTGTCERWAQRQGSFKGPNKCNLSRGREVVSLAQKTGRGAAGWRSTSEASGEVSWRPGLGITKVILLRGVLEEDRWGVENHKTTDIATLYPFPRFPLIIKFPLPFFEVRYLAAQNQNYISLSPSLCKSVPANEMQAKVETYSQREEVFPFPSCSLESRNDGWYCNSNLGSWSGRVGCPDGTTR